MPVSLNVTIPDVPDPPGGYVVVAVEVRVAGTAARTDAYEKADRAIYPYCTDGWERAAGDYLTRAVAGQEFVAIAWFADRPLMACKPGRERLVARYLPPRAGLAGGWSDWEPEEVVTRSPAPANPQARKGVRSVRGLASSSRNGADLGDGVES